MLSGFPICYIQISIMVYWNTEFVILNTDTVKFLAQYPVA
jgi:hypothetical protein